MSVQPTAMKTENIVAAKRGRARGWIDWRPNSGTRDTINIIKGVLAENADYIEAHPEEFLKKETAEELETDP